MSEPTVDHLRWITNPEAGRPSRGPGVIDPADLPEVPELNDRVDPADLGRARPEPRPAAPGSRRDPKRAEGWLARWRIDRAAKAEQAEQQRLRPEDLKFLGQLKAAQVRERTAGTTAVIWLMLIGTAVAGTWAATTRIEQITRVDARVIPEGREQVISSLEGGILRELVVHEGSQVQAGEPLVKLDPTRFESQQNEGEAKRLALKASLVRLNAEAWNKPLIFPPEVAKVPGLVESESEAYRARRSLTEEAVNANAHSIALVQRELAVAEAMSERGLMSEVEVMRLRRQIGEMRQQSVERRSRFRQEASTELLRVQAELAQLEEQMVAREDAVRRTVISSPVTGTVKNIRLHTLGGVVNPGAAIMEIVPHSDHLKVEARIKPADVGFVHVGQKATVKLSAYEYGLYGGLQGEVASISPDAIGDTERSTAAGQDGSFFRVLIHIEGSTLAAHGQPLQVIPGMTGSVEINTGERSVLDFILRPLLKVREAFREQ